MQPYFLLHPHKNGCAVTSKKPISQSICPGAVSMFTCPICLFLTGNISFFAHPTLHQQVNNCNCYDDLHTFRIEFIFSRPGRRQGLLYKQPRDSFIHSASHPFPPTALRRRHAQTVRDRAFRHKIDYVIVIKSFLIKI